MSIPRVRQSNAAKTERRRFEFSATAAFANAPLLLASRPIDGYQNPGVAGAAITQPAGKRSG
jgi:hypothetical protein